MGNYRWRISVKTKVLIVLDRVYMAIHAFFFYLFQSGPRRKYGRYVAKYEGEFESAMLRSKIPDILNTLNQRAYKGWQSGEVRLIQVDWEPGQTKVERKVKFVFDMQPAFLQKWFCFKLYISEDFSVLDPYVTELIEV